VYILIAAIKPQYTEEAVGIEPLVSGICVVASNQISHNAIPTPANQRASGKLITTQAFPQT